MTNAYPIIPFAYKGKKWVFDGFDVENLKLDWSDLCDDSIIWLEEYDAANGENPYTEHYVSVEYAIYKEMKRQGLILSSKDI